MNWRRTVYRIRVDLYRYGGARGRRAFLYHFLRNPGFHCTTLFRLCQYLRAAAWTRWTVGVLAAWLRRRAGVRYGISLPVETEVGPGLYIGHFGGIVVNGGVRIGPNCNLSQNVTLGKAHRGGRAGVPALRAGVYVGPGAVVIGAIRVGDNAAIGANAVVTRDVAPGTVVGGVPAREISHDGAVGLVNHTDYETVFGAEPATRWSWRSPVAP